MVKISVIVPIFNTERYLGTCLRSLQKQTFDDFEVIMVDDGSTDDSYQIAKKIAAADRRFCYYYKVNGGLSDARNYGISKAQGEYLFFLDSDDFIDVKMFEILFSKIEQEDVVRFLHKNFYEDKPPGDMEPQNGLIINSSRINFQQCLLLDMPEPSCFYLYKRQFWQEYKFEFAKGRLHEDFGLIPYVLAMAESIKIVNYAGYFYLQRAGSISNDQLKIKKRFNDIKWHFNQSKYYSENISLCKNKQYRKIYDDFMANGLLRSCKLLSLKDRKEICKNLKKEKIHRKMLLWPFKKTVKRIIVLISPCLFLNLI